MAMTILIMVFSSVVLVAYGNQSMLVDSQLSGEALNKAQEILENFQALARQDFKLVNPIVLTPDGIFQKKVDVQTQPDLFTKKVTATISWTGEHKRSLSTELSALVTNFENFTGGDTCDSVIGGDWTNPVINSFLVTVADAGAKLALDAYKGKLYAAVSDSASVNAPTIFVFDLINPLAPSLLALIDNTSTIKTGISDIRAAGKYLYAAKALGPSSGQLQIFDISGALPVQVGADFKVPGVTGVGAQAIGKSIFYKDGYVYLGLAKTATGPEFNIIDVHNPASPVFVGGFAVGNGVNAIFVKAGHAFLATPNSEELIILDVSNPYHLSQIGVFDAPDSVGNGKSFYFVGNSLYFGRTVTASNPEFYILNITDPAAVLPLGSQEISDSINGLITRDYLSFLLTNSQLQIWRTDNVSGIVSYAAPLALPSGGTGNSLDCEGNYLYTGSIDSSNRAYLSVISAP